MKPVPNIGDLKLVGYERTRAEANELAWDHFQETGIRCIVVNLNGTRARKNTYDKPWQVREKSPRTGIQEKS